MARELLGNIKGQKGDQGNKGIDGDENIVMIDHFITVESSDDVTLEIQKAIDKAFIEDKNLVGNNKEYNIKRLYFKKNNYLLGNTIFKTLNDSGNVYSINCEEGSNIDKINLKLSDEISNERFVIIKSNCKIGDVVIESNAQYSSSNDLLDSAIYINGDNIIINSLKTNNIDYSIIIYNCINLKIKDIDIRSYKRGLYIRTCKKINISNLNTSVKSINSVWGAGNNGLLIEECEDILIDNINIADTGEHGIRLGGLREGKYKQKNFTFNNIKTERTDGCGFKIYSGEVGGIAPAIVSNVYIDNLKVIDACYNMPKLRNRDGVYIVYCNDCFINNINVYNASSSFSSNDGIYISGCYRIRIKNVYSVNNKSSGLVINTEHGIVNDLYIDSINIRKTEEELIKISMSGEVLRDIIIKNIYGREYKSDYGVTIDTSLVYQPLLLTGNIKKTGTGTVNILNPNVNIYNQIIDL